MTEVVDVPSPRERPAAKSSRSGAHRETILDAATHLFGEYGYNGASMRDIAKSVGILPGSLYAHISSKEAILLEIIETGVDRFLDAMDALSSSETSPDNHLRLAVREHLALVAENPQRSHIIFHQWRFLNKVDKRRVLAKRATYAVHYIHIIEDGIELGCFDSDIDPKIAVLSILGTLNWTPEWLSPEGPEALQILADRIVENIIYGLAGRRTPTSSRGHHKPATRSSSDAPSVTM